MGMFKCCIPYVWLGIFFFADHSCASQKGEFIGTLEFAPILFQAERLGSSPASLSTDLSWSSSLSLQYGISNKIRLGVGCSAMKIIYSSVITTRYNNQQPGGGLNLGSIPPYSTRVTAYDHRAYLIGIPVFMTYMLTELQKGLKLFVRPEVNTSFMAYSWSEQQGLDAGSSTAPSLLEAINVLAGMGVGLEINLTKNTLITIDPFYGVYLKDLSPHLEPNQQMFRMNFGFGFSI